MGSVYGYVRVSTQKQNVDRQLRALRHKGIGEERIYIDRASGWDFNRLRYRALTRRLKRGDTLYDHSIDHLGRSYADIPVEWNRLPRRKGMTIKVLDLEMLDTDRLLSHIEAFLMQVVLMLVSFLAEDERLRMRQKQAEGIAAAKARGVRFGRPKKLVLLQFAEVCMSWRNGTITVRRGRGVATCPRPPSTARPERCSLEAVSKLKIIYII